MDRVMIIAEAGVNHNGSVALAEKMIDAAVEAGADAVKFQTFRAQKLVTAEARMAAYQKRNTGKEESQYAMLKRLELDREAHERLMRRCEERGVIFMSTPFDLESIDMLADLGLEIFKIGSGELTNLPYLRKIGALKRRVILSTGMGTLGEVEAALEVLTTAGTPRSAVTLLHANTMYPTPFEDVNLRAMQTLACAFGCAVGYSDHTPGIEVPVAAVALGARIIEKHFTLDKRMAGPDHKASLEPDELSAMVRAVRRVERALGDGIKRPTASEKPNIPAARKSIVAARDIAEGEVLSEENLTTKRPGTGMSPMRWDEIIGTKALRAYRKDEPI